MVVRKGAAPAARVDGTRIVHLSHFPEISVPHSGRGNRERLGDGRGYEDTLDVEEKEHRLPGGGHWTAECEAELVAALGRLVQSVSVIEEGIGV